MWTSFQAPALLLKQSFMLAALCAAAASASAAPVVYNFDGLSDGMALTSQIAGLTFGNATVIKAGLSLNEFEFPPRSGDGVVFDDGGGISIAFDAPVFSVGAYVNYALGLNFEVFDAGNLLLGSTASAFGVNLASSGELGSSPNELISFTDAGGRIARLVITGDLVGGSFTMDDLTVDAGNTVPEPSSLALVAGLFGAWFTQNRVSRRKRPG